MLHDPQINEYLDFDLVVHRKQLGVYPVWATTPAWGEVKGEMRLDPDSEHIRRFLDAISVDETSEEMLVEFGTLLFDGLLPRDVTAALMVSLGHARSREAGLRIRLLIDSPELRPLPWEFLYVPFLRSQLGADVRTPLTRSIGAFGEIVPIETKLPLQVLVVAPRGSNLNTKKEIAHLKEAIEDLSASVALEVLDGTVTLTRLTDALEADVFHVLHFIGHGKLGRSAGHLEINDDHGDPDGLSEDQLTGIFQNHQSMKLIVLNTCEGGATLEAATAFVGIAPNLVGSGIPAVVAHQYPVTDESAITFSRTFYRALTRGPNPGLVEAAVARARTQLRIEHPSSRVVGATVLYMRGPSGRLFTIEPPTPEKIVALEQRMRAKEELVTALRNELEAARFPTEAQKRQLAKAEAECDDLREEVDTATVSLPDR